MDVDRPTLLNDAALLEALEQEVIELAVGLRLLLEHLELNRDLVSADLLALAGVERLAERPLLLLGDVMVRLEGIHDVPNLLLLEVVEIFQRFVEDNHLRVLRPVLSGLQGFLPDHLHLLVLHGDDDRVRGDLGDAPGGLGILDQIHSLAVSDLSLDAAIGRVYKLGADLTETLAAEVLRLAAAVGPAGQQRQTVLLAVLLDGLLGGLHPILGLLDLLVQKQRGGLGAFDPQAEVPVDISLGDGVGSESGKSWIDRFEANPHDPAVADRLDLEAGPEGFDEFRVAFGLHRGEGITEDGFPACGGLLIPAVDQAGYGIGSLVFGVLIQVQAVDDIAGDRAGFEDLVLGLVEVLAGRVDHGHLILRGEDIRVGALDQDLGGGEVNGSGSEQVDERCRDDDQHAEKDQLPVVHDRAPKIVQVNLFHDS